MRRLSVDAQCKDAWTCPSVHVDDADPTDLVIVGHPVPAGTVPLDPGEIAIRVKRQVIADAGVSCPSVPVADDAESTDLVIVGHPVPAGTVPLGPGEIAIRVRRQVFADAGIR